MGASHPYRRPGGQNSDGPDRTSPQPGYHQWSVTAQAPPAPADVTVTASTQALAALIFAGSDAGLGMAGETGAVQRFRRLIGTMGTVVP